MSQPADHHARHEALDPNQSFAVSAPAGSGKTGLLTQRVLKLLALCQHPEEVLSITFTRKAAAEMQLRIFSALSQASIQTEAPDSPHELLTWQLARNVLEQDKKHNWYLLQTPSRLRVLTIDGFSRNLAGQLPLASGLGALPDTLEHPEKAYQDAIQDVFDRIDTDESLLPHWQRVLRHLDNNAAQAQSLLVQLLGKRDQWLATVHQVFVSSSDVHSNIDFNRVAVANLVTETLNNCRQTLAHHGSDLAICADYASRQLSKEGKTDLDQLLGITGLPEACDEALSQWWQLSHLLLKADNEWRNTVNKNIGFPAGANKEEKAICKQNKDQFLSLLGELKQDSQLLEQLQQVRLLPSINSTDVLGPVVDSLSYLLLMISAQLKLVFRRHGATDFIELGQAALQALGNGSNPSDTALKLDYKIQHILVDEFQDTAEPQLQLLRQLTAGWESGDGRSLFIVGDGMQSCYSFRNANVGLFLEARNHGIGDLKLKALDLTVNFRSQTGVVEWVNDTFNKAFPANNDIARGAVSYSASIAFKPALSGAPCLVDLFTSDDTVNPQELKQALADTLVKKVLHIRQQFSDDSIAILVRNRSHLKDILPSLQAAGLKWLATDIDPLASRMVIKDLLNLCRALLFPSDRIAWLSVLRSPVLGLDMNELWLVCNHELQPFRDGWGRLSIKAQLKHAGDLSGLGMQSKTRIKHFNQVIEHAQSNQFRKPVRQWIEGIWLSLGGPSCLLNQDDIDNVENFFELLGMQGYLIEKWDDFVQAVNKLYAKPDANADPNLQVMTIHKSKGLEFDHVIIPGLDRAPRSNDKELLLLQQRINSHGHSDLMLAPVGAKGEKDSKLYEYLRHEAKKKLDFEASRLLYVGCTRAIKHLHLMACVKLTTDGYDLKPPSSASLLAKIWPIENPQLHTVTSSLAIAEDNEEETGPAAADLILQLDQQWQLPALPQGQLLQQFRGQELDDDEVNIPDPYNSDQVYYRHMGTTLHRALQQICIEGVEHWDEQKIQNQLPFWQAQLLELGLWPEACTTAANTIGQAIKMMSADITGLWLLNNQHQQSECELSLWSQGAESIIDRCFVDAGHRWVIDYKSAQLPDGTQLEDFLEAETDAYQGQLQRYRKLASELGPEPVKCALYFPLLNHLEVIE